MLKKLCVVLSLTIPTCCWAWGPGFYVGAGVGVDTTDFNQTAYVKQPPNFDVKETDELAAQGVLGNIFTGYAIQRGMFYLAGELNGNVSTAANKNTNTESVHGTESQTNYKINRSWGVGLLPGIVLPETTILYGRIGYVSGRYVVTTSDTSLADTNTNLNGLRYGLGIDKRICKNFSMRFEYSRINYRSYSATTLTEVSKRTAVQPDSNQFELGFEYKFC